MAGDIIALCKTYSLILEKFCPSLSPSTPLAGSKWESRLNTSFVFCSITVHSFRNEIKIIKIITLVLEIISL